MRTLLCIALLLLSSLAFTPAAQAHDHTGIEPCEGGVAVVVGDRVYRCIETRATIEECDGVIGLNVGGTPFCVDPIVGVEDCGVNGFWITFKGQPITTCFEWQ